MNQLAFARPAEAAEAAALQAPASIGVIARGGVGQQKTGTTRFPAPVIFGHFLLTALGIGGS